MKTLDLEQAADFLKVSPSTAQEMAASGKLPGAKIGRAWVFLVEDLVEYLREQVCIQREVRREQTQSTAIAVLLPKRSRRRELPELPELPSQV